MAAQAAQDTEMLPEYEEEDEAVAPSTADHSSASMEEDAVEVAEADLERLLLEEATTYDQAVAEAPQPQPQQQQEHEKFSDDFLTALGEEIAARFETGGEVIPGLPAPAPVAQSGFVFGAAVPDDEEYEGEDEDESGDDECPVESLQSQMAMLAT
jgi:hypothetical protein